MVLFRFLLDMSYGTIVSETLSYVGYEYSPRGFVGISVSYLFTIILASLFSPDLRSVSRVVVFYLFLFTYVPISTLYAQNDSLGSSPYFLLTACFLLLILGVRVMHPELRKSLVPRFKKGFAIKFSLVAAVITLAVLLAKYGVPSRLPSLMEVYDVRESYKETFSRLIGYAVGWQGNVFNGFLFIVGILRRRMLLVTVALLLQVYLYSITGFKSLLFSYIFIIWLVIGSRFFSRYLAHYLVGTICLSLVAIIVSTKYVEDLVLLPGIFLARLYFVPALLFNYYYDFFSYHYIDLFAQNLPVSLFINSNYKIPIPYVIGDYYFGRAEMSANANFFANGYANLGIAGCLLVTLILIAILHGLDLLSAGKNQLLVLSVVAMPMFYLTNSSFQTTFLTHGFLMAITIIFLLPEEE